MTNWDDFRFLLAIEDTGSFSAAARKLEVSQPTVSRRILELERHLEVPLVDRLPEGVRLTPAGRRICGEARLLQHHAAQIELSARDASREDTARVRVTSSEGIAFAFLTQLIARFQERHPEIAVDLTIANRPADLLRREADIAVRLGNPAGESLVGRRLGTARFGLYGHDSYLAQFGVPEGPEDLSQHRVIEATGDIADLPQAVRLRRAAVGARVAYSTNSILNQLTALRQGIGLLALPAYLAQDAAQIRRVLPEAFDLQSDLWLLSERQAKDQPAIRVLLDYLAREIAQSLRRLSP
ncbi:MAG: LysR family transcriptional regulator [Pseudomonadota bacterium]